jgi:hypothetical protein
MFKISFIFFLLHFSCILQATSVETDSNIPSQSKGNERFDSKYVISYYDRLCLTFSGNIKGLEMKVHNPDSKIESILYKPNTNFYWSFALKYKFFSFSYSTKIKVLDDINPKKGNTKESGMQMAFIGKKMWFTMMYQYYRGFYMNNPLLMDPQWFSKHENYYTRGDIRNLVLSAGLIYAFNSKRYSQTAILGPVDRQIKSAGSPIVGMSLTAYSIGSDSSMVSKLLWDKYPAQTHYTGSLSFDYCNNLGYMYTFVFFKHLILNFGLNAGIALQSRKTYLEQAQRMRATRKIGFTLEYRANLGFNSEKYYFGVMTNGNTFTDNAIEGGYISLHYNYFKFYLGRRFNFSRKNR